MSEVHTQKTYDLPFGFSDNRIVLLPKDPYWLYAYWEISDKKKTEFSDEFGSALWEKSIPVIKITNITRNTWFYIRINDSINSWYINVTDADCLYIAELGRQVSEHFFINLASSNHVYTPGMTTSSNASSYFINYKDLRKGVFDRDPRTIYESYANKSEASYFTGISSPELMHINFQETAFGISSAELFGINLHELYGISSAVFYHSPRES